MSIESKVVGMAKAARAASLEIAKCPSDKKNEVLVAIANNIEKRTSHIQEENQKDLARAKKMGLADAMIDRLTVTDATIKSMSQGLREVAQLNDPVGSTSKVWLRPNGLKVSRMRIPLGVIGIIYESRPNVTIDAAGLCLKAGNAVILRGGSEALNSNQALAGIVGHVLGETGLPQETVQVVPVRDRKAVNVLLNQEEFIDLIIPRGGEGLIRFVVEHSTIPVLKHYKGVCHVYVDEKADIEMAQEICYNSKVQRPGVCNATETFLFHAGAAELMVDACRALMADDVELRACPRSQELLTAIAPPGKLAAMLNADAGRSSGILSRQRRMTLSTVELSPATWLDGGVGADSS